MKQSKVSIAEGTSGHPDIGNLILSVRTTYPSRCEVVIGRPGQPNVLETMKLGETVLYETPDDGIIEVRLVGLSVSRADFLLSQVSPRPGLAAGLLVDDPSNLPFSEVERTRISESISNLNDQLKKSGDFTETQLNLINRKLDEIDSASQRLGRKDWFNYVAGTLTTLCISAAFAPEATKSLFQALNTAFSWLFAHAPTFLQW